MPQNDDPGTIPIKESSAEQQFNILELYSGIGGFHYALKKLLDSMKVKNYRITGVDINTTANAIYRHNHVRNIESGDDKCQHVLLERNIQSFTPKELDRMKLNLITMSPPCQPFSRLGLKRDLEDNRCKSFRHLMSTLPLCQNKPEFIMLENVKGFDTSEAHELLIQTLTECGYRFEEFLLSPNQFSIPNSRQRYYLIARKSNIVSTEKYVPNIHTKVPVIASNRSIFENETKVEFVDHIALTDDDDVQVGDSRSTIEKYLQEPANLLEHELTSETLLRYHMLFDLVDRHSTSTNCFTKAYAHRIEGCGSILKTAPDSITIDNVYAQVNKLKEKDKVPDSAKDQVAQLLASLHLRYFTPREIANLMCFPPSFEFPANINHKQQYRVLGNSVNVTVCYYLLRILLGTSV